MLFVIFLVRLSFSFSLSLFYYFSLISLFSLLLLHSPHLSFFYIRNVIIIASFSLIYPLYIFSLFVILFLLTFLLFHLAINSICNSSRRHIITTLVKEIWYLFILLLWKKKPFHWNLYKDEYVRDVVVIVVVHRLRSEMMADTRHPDL